MKNTNIRVALLVFAAVCLFAATASAQKQTPPPGGPPKPFSVPASQSYALPNGLKVTLIPYGNIPKVALDLSIASGNMDDPPELAGLSDILSQLLKEGTTTLSSAALAETAARMGSSLGV